MASEEPLRTGVLFKKGSGTGPFGRRNWKPRFFVLTPRKLSYYTYEDGELKGEVDLTRCTDQSIEVMPADSMKTGSSASTIWRIAINASDRRFIVAAGTELEMNDWVEQFLVAFHINSGQPLPQRRSMMQQAPPTALAGGATAANGTSDMDLSRNSITDFQNFAVARRSVSGSVRASLGVHPGTEFRLSDEFERQKQAEQHRLEEQRQHMEMEAERLREEELLQAHLRSQAEERRKEKERAEALQHGQRLSQEQDQQRSVESMLDEQRRLKREQHERDREEAERQLRELDMKEEEKDDDRAIHEVEILRRPMPSSPVCSPVAASPLTQFTGTPPRSSLIDDTKKEAMLRQQAEHDKRREAAIKDLQEQTRKDFVAQQQQQIHSVGNDNGHGNAVTPSSPSAQFLAKTSVEF